MSQLRLFLALLLMSFFQPSIAADQNSIKTFAEALDKDFFGFESIDYQTLEQMINDVPEQTTLWGCGLHQCGHIVSCANRNGDGSHQLSFNYQEPTDYPLSINVNPRQFGLQLPGITTDEQGNFRVGPVPTEMADFINQKLPASYSHGAKAESGTTLSVESLIELVRGNLALNMPTLVYYVVDNKKMLIHFYSIVGVNDSGDVPEFMVLDTKGIGSARLKQFTVDEFHQSMNAQSIVDLVKGLDRNFGSIIRMFTASQKGSRIVFPSKLGLWENYSIMRFVPKSELPPQGDEKPEKTGCAQQ